MGAFAEDLLAQKQPDLEMKKPSLGRSSSREASFAAACTVCLLLLFAVPSWTLIWTSIEPAVAYWNATWYWALLVIPLLILAVHMWQVTYGPNKQAVTAAVMIPAVLLLLMLLNKQVNTGYYSQELFSIDCNAFPEKAALQLEWEAARDFFDQCVTETFANKRQMIQQTFTKEFLTDTFRVQDCTQYEEVYAAHAKTWGYLSTLEEKFACTGFCVPGQQLWSHGPHKDSCSVAVSASFQYFVAPRAQKSFLLVFAIIVVTALLFPFLPSDDSLNRKLSKANGS